MFNREVILPRAVEVTNLVIAHCNNIRSKISGAAIEALKELYRFLKKALIQNLEFSVKVIFSASRFYESQVGSPNPLLSMNSVINHFQVTDGGSWEGKRISARKMRKMLC